MTAPALCQGALESSLLTANRSELSSPAARRVAMHSGRPLAQVLFRFSAIDQSGR